MLFYYLLFDPDHCKTSLTTLKATNVRIAVVDLFLMVCNIFMSIYHNFIFLFCPKTFGLFLSFFLPL